MTDKRTKIETDFQSLKVKSQEYYNSWYNAVAARKVDIEEAEQQAAVQEDQRAVIREP